MSAGNEERTDDTAELAPLGNLVAKHYETEPRVHAHVEIGARTHPGLVRPNNEDQFSVVRRYRGREILATTLPEGLFEPTEDHAYAFTVADGMGGRHFGEIASLLALMIGWELGGDEVKWPVRINEHEEQEIREKAQVFFNLVNKAIHEQVKENPRLAGMGTTLTVCYTTGPELFVMHAGDSRAYLFRGGSLRRLTRDHNVAQLLVDQGEAEPDSPEARRMRHVLTNVLGGPDATVQVDVHRHRLAEGDVLMLCSDGLNDLVTDDDIARVLSGQPAPNDACRTLVDLALERGGRDNVTVVLARYHFTDAPLRPERPLVRLPPSPTS